MIARFSPLFLISCLLVSQVSAEVVYRETFGRLPGSDESTNLFDWADFRPVAGASPATFNIATSDSGINGSTDGRPIDVANVNAGTNSDGSTGALPNGIHFFLTGAGAPVLSFTPEYTVDPTLYLPGSIQFSWYQGDANAADTMRLVVRVGGQWYANASTFSTTAMSLGNFPSMAELKQVTYNPAAANWLNLNFDGVYTGGANGTDGTVLSLGAAAASDLSGSITAFGLLVEGAAGTRRFDTFQIDATRIPEPATIGLVLVAAAGLGLAARRRQ
jgi:PEP-CTERM motif